MEIIHKTNSNSTERIEHCLQCSASIPLERERFCCHSCELLYELNHDGTLPVQSDSLEVEQLKKEFAYLDLPSFEEKYRWSKDRRIFKFYVEGLQCSSCVHLLEDLPRFYTEVLSARINFAESTFKVEVTSKAEIAKVMAIIQELGYKPVPLKVQQNTTDHYKKENRASLKRIAIAGAVAGNIMLFTIPIYAGLAGRMGTIFNWISFFLFIPIVTFCATPFYKGAWNSLKYKVISVDLPIVIALMSGYILSTYNLVVGNNNIYYDSTSSFIFLILSSRYLLKRIQQHYLNSSDYASFFPNTVYTKIEKNSLNHKIEIPVGQEDLIINDTVIIKNNQTIPTDGILVSDFANMNMSLLNGESLPQKFISGMKVYAGTQNVGADLVMTVTQTQKDTRLGQILQRLETESMSKSRYVGLTEKWAQILIVTVTSLAGIFFFIYSIYDTQEALNRSLALMILACPCALSFGTPLAYGLALKKARQQGMILKTGEVFEKLMDIEAIAFDKTGTLTSGTLDLTQTFPENISDEYKNMILNLESVSLHPIASALRRAWGSQFQKIQFTDAKEVIGQGVEAYFEGNFYELKSHSLQKEKDLIQTTFSINHKPVGYLYFNDSIRPDTASVIKKLHSKKIDLFILSGDQPSSVKNIAAACGLSETNTFGGCSPEDKLKFVSSHKNLCMIGDGANDALALQKSHLGIAVQGSVDLSLQHSDVYFTRGGLSPVLDLYHLAEKTQKTVHRNITISLIYNVIGGALSLMGLIDPMWAAILMPISSALIVLSTVWGLK